MLSCSDASRSTVGGFFGNPHPMVPGFELYHIDVSGVLFTVTSVIAATELEHGLPHES